MIKYKYAWSYNESFRVTYYANTIKECRDNALMNNLSTESIFIGEIRPATIDTGYIAGEIARNIDLQFPMGQSFNPSEDDIGNLKKMLDKWLSKIITEEPFDIFNVKESKFC